MPRVKYTSKDVDLLARLMRAEAKGEGKQGMLLVGNVVVNRVIANCDVFKKANTVKEVIYQNPGGFEGVKAPLFEARATKTEKELAKKVLDHWKEHPATRALWFKNPGKGKDCPARFWGELSGDYKNHCFYNPSSDQKCYE